VIEYQKITKCKKWFDWILGYRYILWKICFSGTNCWFCTWQFYQLLFVLTKYLRLFMGKQDILFFFFSFIEKWLLFCLTEILCLFYEKPKTFTVYCYLNNSESNLETLNCTQELECWIMVKRKIKKHLKFNKQPHQFWAPLLKYFLRHSISKVGGRFQLTITPILSWIFDVIFWWDIGRERWGKPLVFHFLLSQIHHKI